MAALNADVLARWRGGEVSAPLALMLLALEGADRLAERLVETGAEPLAALAAEHGDGLEKIAAMRAAGLDHRPPPGVDAATHARALFERIAAVDADAASAAYALGDPALLAEATREVVTVLEAWAGVRGACVLDLGCGSGRLSAALAESGAAFVVGVDLSPAMLRAARARRVGALVQVGGGGLPLAPASFDLVVAADVFPYLTAGGPAPAAAMLAECARVLRPGGRVVICNWSYDGAVGPDAAAAGLRVERAGERPFTLWDARAWALRR